MEIGNDDIDFMENEYNQEEDVTQDVDNQEEDTSEDSLQDSQTEGEDDFISQLLRSRGIEDPSKIKFEGDDGEIEEVDWNSLSVKDRLNVLESANADDSEGLNDLEILLINAIRLSNLTPAEYLQGIGSRSIQNYVDSLLNQSVYSVDLYSDEELFVMDLISKSQDITEEEALEALERAKSNDAIFKKQITAIRNDYKRAEEESINYLRLQLELNAQAQFLQFADSIEDTIINFKDFAGCELNMSDEDMEDLYTFITGTDNAGNSWFGKALNDPETIVKMAWFALNGELMIADINEYYQKEISKVRKESYDKGVKDRKDTTNVTYKPKGKKVVDYDDLDDFS